ncbi:MAG: hypothetical protein Ct9H90mP13_01590 [Pseudomonadota bacterium]|nr:MAG: hypothetical protein Ct9H90mP13_01590 [Pseudomonadota bacterium]
MDLSSLNSIAQSMVAPNKGILAADESTPTIGKRFAQLIQNQLKAIANLSQFTFHEPECFRVYKWCYFI